jgi:pyruvate dehydrogenase E1 component alpha subunit
VRKAWTAAELKAFEREVADAFEAAKIRGPVHLSDGGEEDLIHLFETEIAETDWVFSAWRSHYHALLHGVPRKKVMAEILAGRSMMLHFPEHRFFTSAVVGGTASIACGVAAALKERSCAPGTCGHARKVWCFVGDMTATTGAFHEAEKYAEGHDLPITFVVEDNGLATETPTEETWGRSQWRGWKTRRFYVKRGCYPHVGTGKYVAF